MSARKESQILHFLKEEEAQAHTLRKEKADKFHSEQVMDKITEKNQKLEHRMSLKEQKMRTTADKLKKLRIEKDRFKDEVERMKSSVDTELYKSMYQTTQNRGFNTTFTSAFVTQNFDDQEQRINNVTSTDLRNTFRISKQRASLPPTTSIVMETSPPRVQSRIKPKIQVKNKPSQNAKGRPYLFNAVNGSFGILTSTKPPPKKIKKSAELDQSQRNNQVDNSLNSSIESARMPSFSRVGKADEIQEHLIPSKRNQML